MGKHAKPLPGTVTKTNGYIAIKRDLLLPKDERFEARTTYMGAKFKIRGLRFTYRLALKDGAFHQQEEEGYVFALYRNEDGGMEELFLTELDTPAVERINKIRKQYAKKHPSVDLGPVT